MWSEEKFLPLMVSYQVDQGNDSSKKKLGLKTESPLFSAPSPLPWHFTMYPECCFWEHHSRCPWLPIHSPKGGTSVRRAFATIQSLVRWLQMKVVTFKSIIFSSSSGRHHHAFYKAHQDGKNSSIPLEESLYFIFPPLSKTGNCFPAK